MKLRWKKRKKMPRTLGILAQALLEQELSAQEVESEEEAPGKGGDKKSKMSFAYFSYCLAPEIMINELLELGAVWYSEKGTKC